MSHRRRLRDIAARCLLLSGIITAIRLLLWRDRILILVYHDPKPEALKAHLEYLSKIAQPASLSDLGNPPTGRARFVVTIDDGHAGNADLLRIFHAYNVRPTIYLCSSVAGTSRQFWWQHGNLQADHIERLKRLRNCDRLAELATLGFSQEAGQEQPAALSAAAIARMKHCVDFQSHGRFHPILTCCDDEECRSEITRSREEIGRLVGRECVHFAYPNGNYGERELAMVRAAGYRTGRTLDVGWNGPRCDPFRLKAVAVSDDSSVAWFAVQISLIPAYVRYLRQGSLFGRSPQLPRGGAERAPNDQTAGASQARCEPTNHCSRAGGR